MPKGGSQLRIIALLLLMLALLAAQAVQGQVPSRLPEQLSVKTTGVFGVGRAELPPGYTIASAAPGPSRGVVYITGTAPWGQGYVAILRTDGSVEWSHTLEGPGVLVAVDNPSNSRWLAVASRLGDLAVIDLNTKSIYAYYYRALRSKPVQLHVATEGGSLKVVALDSSGSLYVFKPPEEGWFEAAPETGSAALSYQPGFYVLHASPVARVSSLWNRSNTNLLAVIANINPDINQHFYATLNAQVYYVTSAGEVKKAITGTRVYNVSGVELIETRTLRVWIVDPVLHIPETLSDHSYPINQTNGTGTLVLQNLFPAEFGIYMEYEVVLREAGENNIIESYECYTNFTTLSFTPGANVNATIYLHPTNATSPDECELMRRRYVNTASTGLNLVNLLFLNISRLPDEYRWQEDLTLRYIRLKGGLDDIKIVKAYTSPALPEGWDRLGAKYLLLAATDKSLYIYLFNENLTLVGMPVGDWEEAYLGSTPTAVEVSPSLDEIYVGCSNGRVYRLTWSPEKLRYILTGSLVVSSRGMPVTSLRLATTGYLLAATADGAAQLIDLRGWKPLWRGPAVYPAIDLSRAAGLPGAAVGGLWYYPGLGFVGYFTNRGVMLLPYGLSELEPLYPVSIVLSSRLASLNGLKEALPVNANESYVDVFMEGSRVASATFTEEDGLAVATLYLPRGPVTFRVNASIAGDQWVVEWNYTVAGPSSENVTVKLREALVYVYTPEDGGIGYKLTAGPKKGALVTLEPTGVSPNLPYRPVDDKAFTGTTGPDGLARFIIYEGVSYRVTGSLKGYTIEPADADAFGPANVTLKADPVLYTLDLEAFDSEVFNYAGLKYYVPEANVTLTLGETGRSAWILVEGGRATLEIPAGSYRVQIKAAYYEPYNALIKIPEAGTLSAALNPIHFTVALHVNINDTTGLILSPSSVVEVKVKPIDFPLQPESTHTGPDGSAVFKLHWGRYSVTVTHPMLESTSVTINVTGNVEEVITVKPRYSRVNITVLDADLVEYGVLVKNALVTLTYNGPFTGGSVTIDLEEGFGSVTLPYGYYTLSATAGGYQTSTFQLAVNTPQDNVTITVQPIRYPVRINVHVIDPVWNLASGPLAGALVTVKLVSPSYPLPPSTLLTGNDGTATFNLRGGEYLVVVQHELIGNYTERIHVAGTVSVTLQPKPIYVDVNLKVVDSEQMLAVPQASLTMEYTGVTSRKLTITVKDGSFRGLLPAGNYVFTASEPHYYEASIRVKLVGVSTFNLTILMKPIYQDVTIRVLSASVVVNGTRFPEAPIPGAEVRLTPSDPVLRSLGITGYAAVTDEEGVARLKVRVGFYNLSVSADYFYATATNASVLSEKRFEATVKLKPVLNPVKLKILDGELEPEHASIAGTLTLTSWNDIPLRLRVNVPPGGAILLLPAGSYEALVESPGYQASTFNFTVPGDTYTFNLTAERLPVKITVLLESVFGSSPASNMTLTLTAIDIPLKVKTINLTLDSSGSIVAGLRRGNYTVQAAPLGYAQPVTLGTITVSTGGEEYTFTVEAPTFTLNLTAVDSEFKEYTVPVNATITYLGPYGSGEYSTSLPAGRASLELPPGSYQITLTSPFYYTYTTPLNLTASTNVTVELDPRRASVNIVVKDIDGNPVSRARVILRHQILPYAVEAVTGKGGGATLEDIRLGSYTLTATPPAGVTYLKPSTSNVTITAESRSFTVILMPKSFNVTIVLIDATTNKMIPFPYTLTLARKGAGSALLSIPSNVTIENGTVSLMLPYGDYTGKLEPVEEDYYILPDQVSFTVDKNETLTIKLEPRVYSLEVIVVDDRGMPVPNARVVLIDVRGNVRSAASTNEDGQAVLKAPYGVYMVEATKSGYKRTPYQVRIPDTKDLTIELEPGLLVILKRYSTFIIGIAGLAVIAYGILKLRSWIAEKIAEEEEYF
ncbi:MSCRAMM family protein [Stetteria hydrogenophila]